MPVRLYYTMSFRALPSKTGMDAYKTNQKTAPIPSPIPDPIIIITQVEPKYAVLIHL